MTLEELYLVRRTLHNSYTDADRLRSIDNQERKEAKLLIERELRLKLMDPRKCDISGGGIERDD